jgi:hypothetical protein
LADNNSSTYNVEQIKQADAILKGMELSNTKIDNTIISPFYNNKQNSTNPFIPVTLPENKFSDKSDITRKNPLGDLRWLIGK